MRKLLVAALVLSATYAAQAASLGRDVVLTPKGVVYTVESDFSRNYEVESASSTLLHVNIQDGDKSISTFVPASLRGGLNLEPALAYDAPSDTLFVFWQKRPNPTSSELLLCSLHNGEWSEPTSISAAIFNIRFNLRVLTTQSFDPDNPAVKTLLVHAVWWEQTGYGEEAHYAMLTMKDGKVAGIENRRLLDFVPPREDKPAELGPKFDRAFFRNISMVENSTHDGVEIVFANWNDNRFEHVGVRPIVGQGVIRVPGGVWHGKIQPPEEGLVSGDAKVAAMADPTRERLAFYSVADDAVNYLVLKDGTWGAPQRVKRSAAVTPELAIDAIRNFLAVE